MDFKALKQLVGAITRTKAKHIPVLGNSGSRSTQPEELYDLLAKGKFQSEQEVAQYFYKTKNTSDGRYLRLKNRLIRQLINTVFFVDTEAPMFSERRAAFYNCHRDYVAALLLYARDSKLPAIQILQQTLEQTIKYEFTELTAYICNHLKHSFSREYADRSNYEKYSKLHKIYEEKRRGELYANDCYEELISYIVLNKTGDDEFIHKAKEYSSSLKELAEKVDTPPCYHCYYQTSIIHHSYAGEYEETLSICNKAISYLLSTQNINRSYITSTVLQKLAALIKLRKFDQTDIENTIQISLKYCDKGEWNWYRLFEVQVFYFFVLRQYNKAFATYVEAVTCHAFDSLSFNAKDTWHLLGGYFQLLRALNKLDGPEVDAHLTPFRYSKFVNNFQFLDKDKMSMNIPIVFLPILYNLSIGNFLEFGRSEEALEKYRQRYLDNDLNRRSNCFLKLLMALAVKPYDPAKAQRIIQKELPLLRSFPHETDGQFFAVEVIPYEDLWEMLSARVDELIAGKRGI